MEREEAVTDYEKRLENELDCCEADLQHYRTQNGRLRKRVNELENKTASEDIMLESFKVFLMIAVIFWITIDILSTIRSW